jgi:hypothetical protein
MSEVDLDGFILIMMDDKRRREESEDFQREIDIEELDPIRIIMREKVGQKSNNNSKAQNSKSLFDQQIVNGLEDR